MIVNQYTFVCMDDDVPTNEEFSNVPVEKKYYFTTIIIIMRKNMTRNNNKYIGTNYRTISL